MKNLKLVCLISGQKKDGNGMWHKATFKARSSNGQPVLRDFFLSEEVADSMRMQGLIDDVDVLVEVGLDDLLRPTITKVKKADVSANDFEVEEDE